MKEKKEEFNQRKRIYILDSFRGITIISMVAFHFCWDLLNLFGLELPWLMSGPGYYWQQSICWSFILLSGFCWSFGRHPLRKGLELFGIGAAITLITIIVMPDEQIIFGILTFLGSAMILVSLLDVFLKKIPSPVGLIFSFFLFMVLKQCNHHSFGIASLSMPIPEIFYQNYLTTYIGFPFRGFFSTDYFAILPWIFLFICGYYLQKVVEDYDLYQWIPDWKEPVFSFLGRHSLIIYVIHQPILYGLSMAWITVKGIFL